jgi:FdhE protein
MGTLRERVQQIKEKRPGYGELLDFYVQVKEAQDASQVSLLVDPVKVKKNGKGLGAEERSFLIEKVDLPIDVEASIDLFRSLCLLASSANPHIASQVDKINAALFDGTLDLKELLIKCGNEQMIEQAAAHAGLDKQVLSFLVRSSTRPSIEARREQLLGKLDLRSWRKGHCPVCGSLPALSLLKGEGGMRYSLCSYCDCQWRVDRLSCSVCGNKEQGALQYFCGEGEEAHRIDLCDACHHYIKQDDRLSKP